MNKKYGRPKPNISQSDLGQGKMIQEECLKYNYSDNEIHSFINVKCLLEGTYFKIY